ncbi:MAG: 3-deoxy-manno-octulosonate cytidylyltransferase [Acidobacteria bacterium]|nr:3-deoxy-manno-octulosonate cytidylyltransferase [Acidobacteriota bacterium]
MKVIGVIPARYGSTRFPGKPLTDILGKPMIQHVYEACKKASLLDEVIVATDDERIEQACKLFSATVMMTDPSHTSGSDRVAEIARKTDGDIYMNIQGDEPLLDPGNIDLAVKPLLDDKNINLSTLKTDIKSIEDLFDINLVKVITDKNDFAIYFSRLPIPFTRDPGFNYENFKHELNREKDLLKNFYSQIGLYVFRKEFLMEFTRLENSKLELLEKLEQLRALENGYKIKVIYTPSSGKGVDSPEDLEKIIAIMKKGNHAD